MILSRRVKESIKTALAMAIAYAIALQVGWDRPYWAAFAVGMISLPAAGASLNKGALRMLGTLVAGVVALILVGLFSQERWWFMIVLSVYLGICTYMMMGKKNQYFYQVCAFVCVIICFDGAGDPVNSFNTTMTRILETGMGIMVYSLIIVFLWPINTRDDLNKTSLQLLSAQRELFSTYRLMLAGKGSDESSQFQREQAVQALTKLEPILVAAEADSYDVWAVRRHWQRFLHESTRLVEILMRCQANFADIEKFNWQRVLPGVKSLGAELDMRFELIQGML
ncbi:MAG: FUSC family protein, partial [Desulfuromusa sp.]|nr:FUSC family protein [Desulfuromusa sp.]